MPQKKNRYNGQMIEDFLDNLLWELRAVHYEVSSAAPPTGPGDKVGINPELCDQLVKYMKRYNHAGLMALSYVDKDPGLTANQKHQAIANYRTARAAVVQEWIDHLEALQPILKEALDCAARSKPIAKVRKLSDFLPHDPTGEHGT
jgi:hypothetical protein